MSQRIENIILGQDASLTDGSEKKIATVTKGATFQGKVIAVNSTPANATTVRLYVVPAGVARADKHAIAWNVTLPKQPIEIGINIGDEAEVWARADDGLAGTTGAVICVMGQEVTG